jgi:hypothetical protein
MRWFIIEPAPRIEPKASDHESSALTTELIRLKRQIQEQEHGSNFAAVKSFQTFIDRRVSSV